MSIVMLLIFTVLSFIFLCFNFIRLCFATLLLTMGMIISIGSGWLPSLLIDPLQIPFVTSNAPYWQARNAIVLLGAGAVQTPDNWNKKA